MHSFEVKETDRNLKQVSVLDLKRITAIFVMSIEEKCKAGGILLLANWNVRNTLCPNIMSEKKNQREIEREKKSTNQTSTAGCSAKVSLLSELSCTQSIAFN